MPTITDCLGYNTIHESNIRISADKVITSVISPGYDKILDDLLFSLEICRGTESYKKIIFLINPDQACFDVVNKWKCDYIICEPINGVCINSKSVLYSLDMLVDFNKMIYLDSDVLCLNPIDYIFNALDVLHDSQIMVSRDFYFEPCANLLETIYDGAYSGDESDFKYLLGTVGQEPYYTTIINAGVIACKKNALIKVRETMSRFNNVHEWVKQGYIREQFLFNLALAASNNAIIMHPKYNYQLCTDATFELYFDEISKNIITHNYFEPFSRRYINNPISSAQKLGIESIDLDSIKIKLNENLFLTKNYNLDSKNINANREKKSQIEFEMSPFVTPVPERMLNANIHLLHFNGYNKTQCGLREACIEALNQKKTSFIRRRTNKNILKFCINTHKDYQERTLPLLIASMMQNKIPRENIIICSAGWDEEDETLFNNIKLYKVSYNAFEHSALILIIEKDIEGEYWFNLHDTAECGSKFYEIILSKEKDYIQHEYSSINLNNALNMGVFKKQFLIRNANYICSLKDCSKQRAILSEHIYPQMCLCHRLCQNYDLDLGAQYIYPDGVERRIKYFQDIDLYKFQANTDIKSNVISA